MKKIFLLILIIALAICISTGCAPTITPIPSEGEGEGEGEEEPTGDRVVLIELFNTDGCSASALINPIMEDLAQQYGTKQVILLEEAGWGKYSTPETMERFDWYVPGDKHTPFIAFNGLSETFSEGIVGGGGGGTVTPKKGSVTGEFRVPNTKKSRDISGWIPWANVTVTLEASNGSTYTTITDNEGKYTFTNIPKGNYFIITASGEIDNSPVTIKDIVPNLNSGEDYNAGIADADSTALALIVEDFLEKDLQPDLNEIEQSTAFNSLVNQVTNDLENYQDVTTDAEVNNQVYNALDETADPWDGWFSNAKWETSSSNNHLDPPGPNYWSDSINNVWKDEQGNLHLRIIKRDGEWYCAGVYTLMDGWGYGKYEFDLGPVRMKIKDNDGNISEVNYLDKQIVFGLFTYDGSDFAHKSHNEIDIEFAQWGSDDLYNGNYTVWYCSEQPQEIDKNNTYPFPIDIGVNTSHSFEWHYDKIVFSSNGNEVVYPNNDFVYKENYIECPGGGDGKDYIPTPDSEKAHLNLWLYEGKPPSDENIIEIETIVEFIDLPDNWSPEIIDFIIDPASPIYINQDTQLTCIAEDPDGDPLTYSWESVNGGSFTGVGSSVKWTAPGIPGTYPVKCIVEDGVGGYCTITIEIEVQDPGASGLVHNLTQDTYYNTIQAALDDANSGDTIEVSDGIYDESITFPSGKKITLQSVNGPAYTIINGNNGSSTITESGSTEVILTGFTITHISGQTGYGIRNYNYSNMTINNCIISNNIANKSDGGGIGNGYGSTLTITGSTISGNSATVSCSGGISNSGNMTIIDCSICNNYALNGGGGISNTKYGTLTITGSTISDNIAAGKTVTYGGQHWDGGGIWNCGGTLTITGSTISGNSASINGGGIFFEGDSTSINIGGSSSADSDDFNTFVNNYKTGYAPSADQHIHNDYADCHTAYPYNYYNPDF